MEYQNNLKQMGVIFAMYSNESKGEKFPPMKIKNCDPPPNNDAKDASFDGPSVYPEYLTDVNILGCPSDSDFQSVIADPLSAELEPDQFDLVLIAQRLSCLGPDPARRLLKKGRQLAKPGGRVVVIDLIRMPAKPNLTDCVESLKLQLETRQGSVPSLEQLQGAIQEAGLVDFQFALISKSRAKLGLAVAARPEGA